MSDEIDRPVRIIACGVFRTALEHLDVLKRYPNLRVSFLPSVLHLRPQDLKSLLIREIISAHERGERIICLYGNCFPHIEDICSQYGVIKVPGAYCYEIFLGPDRFNQIMEETAGTYFVEKELITNFEEHCIVPLELFDEMVRKYCFEHYRKLLYVRQPQDPDLSDRAGEIADFLELSLDIKDADYSFLENELAQLIEPPS